MVGGFVPSTPVDHQHIALKAVPGSELPRDMPCFRDPDNLVYGKSEHGGMVFGGYETDPVSRWEDGVPWEHAARVLPPDYERFAPLMAGAIRRFPFLADAEAIRLVCHPGRDDARREPAARAAPRGPRVLGGGRAVAQRVRRGRRDRSGDGRLDHGRRPGRRHRAVPGVAVQRHVPRPGVRRRAGARDLLGLLPAPLSVRCGPGRPAAAAVRPPRAAAGDRAPCSGRRPAGSAPTTTIPVGRGAAPGGTRRPTAGHARRGSTGSRRRSEPSASACGLIDLSSFGKIAVEGPGALGLLQRVSANDVDRPVGSIVYTPWCDERGGMVADVTVTRLAGDLVPGRDGCRLRGVRAGLAAPPHADGRRPCSSRDVSGDSPRSGCGGLAPATSWPPRRPTTSATRRLPAPAAPAPIRIAGATVLASRISYAGELGWELTTDTPAAVLVWDALRAASDAVDAGLEPFGYRALDALRIEKGYRYFGTDMTMLDTPFEAGLGRDGPAREGPVHRDGRRSPRPARPAGRARVGACGRSGSADDGTYLPVYGGEAVRLAGEVVGRLRSVAYGADGRRDASATSTWIDRSPRGRGARGRRLRPAGRRRRSTRRCARGPGRRRGCAARPVVGTSDRVQPALEVGAVEHRGSLAPSAPRPSRRSRSRSSRCGPGWRPRASSRRRT